MAAARPRVALATCSWWEGADLDLPLLVAALETQDVAAGPAVWDDAAVDWASYDLVVVRSTWDYVPRRAEFLAWARSVPRLANPAEVLAVNTDKRYLLTIPGAVPTVVVEPGDRFLAPVFEHVVKPTVSASSADTRRFAPGEDSAAFAAPLLATGRALLVQPYVAAIDTAGESSLLFFDGVFSHSVRKAPILVPGVDDPHSVAITPREATAAELALATPLAAGHLYARVDLVPGPHGPLLLELELTEPYLFLGIAGGGAVDRFATAIRGRL